MKKLLYLVCLFYCIQVSPYHVSAADPEKIQGVPAENNLLQDAMSLLQIYYKVQRLSGESGGSELKPYLDQINGILDHALTFKESFTPEKKARVETSLKELRKETERFADIPPSKMKENLPKLGDSLWKLIKVLMDS